MSYTVDYSRDDTKLPRWQIDNKAVKDIESYITKGQWKIVRETADLAVTGKDFFNLSCALGFCGIGGYPVHAFGRRFCLTAYREWMRSDDNPVQTDAQGFPA